MLVAYDPLSQINWLIDYKLICQLEFVSVIRLQRRAMCWNTAGASDAERQREARSLYDLTSQSSQNFTDVVGRSADNTSKTAPAPPAAAAAVSQVAEDQDADEDEDLSYDEQDSVGERSAIHR